MESNSRGLLYIPQWGVPIGQCKLPNDRDTWLFWFLVAFRNYISAEFFKFQKQNCWTCIEMYGIAPKVWKMHSLCIGPPVQFQCNLTKTGKQFPQLQCKFNTSLWNQNYFQIEEFPKSNRNHHVVLYERPVGTPQTKSYAWDLEFLFFHVSAPGAPNSSSTFGAISSHVVVWLNAWTQPSNPRHMTDAHFPFVLRCGYLSV